MHSKGFQFLEVILCVIIYNAYGEFPQTNPAETRRQINGPILQFQNSDQTEMNPVLSHIIDRSADIKDSPTQNLDVHINTIQKPPQVTDSNSPSLASSSDQNKMVIEDERNAELQNSIQAIYVAQAQVQLEIVEIQRAQSLASAAQQSLEEAANNVRIITSALRVAQESVANAALRAQTAQLQLAAHDQLLFAARQKVDALSAQMVSLKAEVGINGGKQMTVDLPALLEKLKEPLAACDTPKPIPSILETGNAANGPGTRGSDSRNSHQIKIHSTDLSTLGSNTKSDKLQKRSENETRLKDLLNINPQDIKDFLNWFQLLDMSDSPKENALEKIEDENFTNEIKTTLKNGKLLEIDQDDHDDDNTQDNNQSTVVDEPEESIQYNDPKTDSKLTDFYEIDDIDSHGKFNRIKEKNKFDQNENDLQQNYVIPLRLNKNANQLMDTANEMAKIYSDAVDDLSDSEKKSNDDVIRESLKAVRARHTNRSNK